MNYKLMLQLPTALVNLETKIGVNAANDITAAKVMRAGIQKSGVSVNNRVMERHNSLYGAYWKTYDSASSTGNQNILSLPLGPETASPATGTLFTPDAGEMIFTLPNGLSGYIIATAAGNYLNQGLTTIVIDPDRADQLVTNASYCFSCHANGYNYKVDQIHALASDATTSQQFVSGQLDKILALYLGPDTVKAAMDQDIKAYQNTIAELDLTPKQVEPVSSAAFVYSRNLDLSSVAAELEVSKDMLSQCLGSDPTLVTLLGDLRVPKTTLPRATLQSSYATIAQELTKAKGLLVSAGNSANPKHLTTAKTRAQ